MLHRARGDRVVSERRRVKILGFTFDNKPTVAAHIEETIKKTRRRYWVLRHLKNYGFTSEELVAVYQSLVRSVIEFCSVVYHSLLTDEQSKSLERLQLQALKCIYGYAGESYRSLLEKAGLEKLETRRLAAIDRFTDKCLKNRFASWFPHTRGRRSGRTCRPYEEKYACCDRLRDSPLYFMRRRLNDRAEQSIV
jgi:hypothetical protein